MVPAQGPLSPDISQMKLSDWRELEFINLVGWVVAEWSPGAGFLITLLIDWVAMATDEKSLNSRE